jgi:hypothetical protein
VKIRYIIYINNNKIYLFDKKTNKLYKENFESLQNDEITNYTKFNFEFNKFIKTNHIKISIFGYRISFIKNIRLSNLQINIYKNILNNYFKNINFIDIENLLKTTKNTVIANITSNYIDYYYQKEMLRIDNKIFNMDEINIFNYLINEIYKPKKIILIGNKENISKICNKLNQKYKIKCFYAENFETYIIDLLTTTHK